MTIAVATGAMTVSVAWAGAGLMPAAAPEEVAEVTQPSVGVVGDTAEAVAPPASDVEGVATAEPGEGSVFLEPGQARLPSEQLSDGWYWVGAAKVDIYPRPDDYGGTWERDAAACRTLDEGLIAGEDTQHVAAAGSPWPENPDCIYLGGYGLGPMNPAVDYDDQYGLWVRTIAIHDGTTPLLLTVLDGEGWFWDYDFKCDDCGFKQISQRLGEELGVERSSFVFHATHSHTSPDFIGGWGFVPDWYMQQVTDSIEQSVRAAVADMQQARIEVGEVLARQHNRERRDTYHAPEEQGLAWLRAFVPGETTTETTAPGDSSGKGDGDGNNETTTPTTAPATTIATAGVYGAHPTTVDIDDDHPVAHPDWPGVFEATLEQRFGGIGLHFMSGLGNMSAAGGTQMGARLAALVPAPGSGQTLQRTRVQTSQATWNQPASNAPLTALGRPGFFDRQFQQTPASLRTGENPEEAPCVSASPFSVEVAASAAEIGNLVFVTAGPGELFSNTTNTIKDRAAAAGQIHHALPVAQANDALGYLPESFERAQNPASGQGGGFAASGPAYTEYEDAYSIDRCFGDKTLETTLGLLAELE